MIDGQNKYRYTEVAVKDLCGIEKWKDGKLEKVYVVADWCGLRIKKLKK